MALAAFVVNRTLLRDPRRFLLRCQVAAQDRGWDAWFGPAGGASDSLAWDSLALTRRAIAAGASLVFAAGGDGTVRAWDVAFPAGLPAAACAIAGQSLTRQQWAGYAGTQPFQQVCPAR